MPVVKFNAVHEFEVEVEKDVRHIDRGIVRLTNLFEASRLSPNIRHVVVVAGYTVKGQIIKLERHVGDLWGINQQADQEVMNKAEKVHNCIEDTCKRLGVEVRAGSLQ